VIARLLENCFSSWRQKDQRGRRQESGRLLESTVFGSVELQPLYLAVYQESRIHPQRAADLRASREFFDTRGYSKSGRCAAHTTQDNAKRKLESLAATISRSIR